MRSIWKYLSNHVRQDFNTSQYLGIFVFLAFSLFINYRVGFESNVLDNLNGFQKFAARFLFFGAAYFSTLLITSYSKKEKQFFYQKSFWFKSLLALIALSLDSSLPFLQGWTSRIFPPQVQFWGYKVCVNLISFFTILLPLMIYYWCYEKDETHYYGLKVKNFDSRPYFQMVLIMVPILIGASFHSSFLRAYPLYKTTTAHVYLNIPEWITVMTYELAYGLDFITVEFLFRGFMVIGMISLLGRNAILPMAATYCFLHFGKPPGEAISSVVGGYILGVIAYETKSIWGGIIVHLGIAWLMELIAFIQKAAGS